MISHVADFPNVAYSVDARTRPSKIVDINNLRYVPDDRNVDLGPSRKEGSKSPVSSMLGAA